MSNEIAETIYGDGFLSQAHNRIDLLRQVNASNQRYDAIRQHHEDSNLLSNQDLDLLSISRPALWDNIETILLKASDTAHKQRDADQSSSVMAAYLDYCNTFSQDDDLYANTATILDLAPNVPVVTNVTTLPWAGVIVQPVHFKLYKRIVDERLKPSWPFLTYNGRTKIYRHNFVYNYYLDNKFLNKTVIGSAAINAYFNDLRQSYTFGSRLFLKVLSRSFQRIYPPLGFDVNSDLVGEINSDDN